MNILLMLFGILSLVLCSLFLWAFFGLGNLERWDKEKGKVFESGFSSYHYSRFSFSIQYFLVGMIFLFLDLELCLIFPYFMEDHSDSISLFCSFWLVTILLWGLLEEWYKGKLDWIL